HEVVVDAGDWMTALTRARGQIGERGGVPPGASCAVAPDGKVTILDGVARRQYALATTEEAPSAPASPAPAAAATPPKKLAKHTVAYMPSPLAAPSGTGAPVAVPVGATAPAASATAPAATAPAATAAAATAAPAVPRPASVPPPSAAVPR